MRTGLQRVRKRAGYRSARAFAEAHGYNVNTYTNYEQGKCELTIPKAWELADILGCSLDELAGRDFPAPALEPAERALVSDFRAMDSKRRERLLDDARDYAALSGDAAAQARRAGA